MCGRFTLSSDAATVQAEFNLSELPTLAPRYNIAPSQPVAIITNDQPETLTMVQWGLIPSWSKDPKIAYKMINARSETADSKPSYRAPFKRRRCLIPTSGFYEWVKVDEGKQPYFIHHTEKAVFAFAGLWDIWHSPEGDARWSCTILTTQANDTLQHLHHRMPVILNDDARDIWLDQDSDPQVLKAMMQPLDNDKLAFYPVSKAVNSPKNDHATLIERADPPQQPSLF